MRSQGWVGRGLVLMLLLTLAAGRGHAVLFKSTGDPSFNTNTPTGSLTNSGWQYEGQWIGYLGTPIAPRFFLSVKHINGSPGDFIVFNGYTNHTVALYECPACDLRIWEVAETFARYASLYTASNEVGQSCVVIGRGTQRGSPVVVRPETNGWMWGASDNVQRWGINNVSEIVTSGPLGQFLYCTFDRTGTSNECALSVGDSGGGMFILESGTWKLAGVHYAVDGPFSFDGSTNTQFQAALLDVRGLYFGGGTNWTLIATNAPSAEPAGFYSTRVSEWISWINSVIDFSPGPDLQFVSNQVAGANVQVSLSTGSNRLYRVEHASDIVTGTWTTVTNNLAGTGGIVTVIDPGAASLSKQFYRAVILK